MRPRFPSLALFLFGSALLPLGCRGITSDNERKESAVALSEIIKLTASAPSIVADGKTTVRLSARIPADASTKTVTFSTTAGAFVESASKEVKIFAWPDSANKDKRLATTLLRSDTLGSTAIIRATVGEYYDTVTVLFNKP